MSNLSDFIAGVGVRTIQSDFISATAPASGAGEDLRYWDVTVSDVDVTKTIVLFVGGAADSEANSSLKAGAASGYEVIGRMTTSTNLRLSVPNAGASAIVGRWTVVETR